MRAGPAGRERALWLPQVLILLIAAVLLSTYGAYWARMTTRDQRVADFGEAYTAATIIREGHPGQVYDGSLQASTGDRLMAPDQTVLPFQEVALGAILVIPLTTIPPPDAFRVWSAVQLVLVVVAVAVALRAAPRPHPGIRLDDLAIGAIAVAGLGSADLLRTGQWSGINALGLALAYGCWRRDRLGAGAAVLVATAALAKPHLALALLAFMIGWGNRRVILSAAGTGLVMVGAFVALVGASGVRGFLSQASYAMTIFTMKGTASFLALPSAWFGDGDTARMVGWVGTGVFCAVCVLIGAKVRCNASLLGPALAVATVLALLASPHAFGYDDVIIAPAIAWTLRDLDLFHAADMRRRLLGWATVTLWMLVTGLDKLLLHERAALPAIGAPGVWLTAVLAVVIWASNRPSAARGAGHGLV